ncbi:MAG: UDP-N-acetylglucosamine 1-carboxyvinyltransferase, partial [Oscillospiraceae bacterium]
MPHPGFPTDMQPQFAVLLSLAEGMSIISESVWDNRFRYADQLTRMGAIIHVDGKTAFIEGVDSLKGAPVKADDLRAGAAMMIAAMVAKGVSEIEDIYHIERGYEDVVDKFKSLGASIERVDFPDNEGKKSHQTAG